MKIAIRTMVALVLISLVIESCHKPPISTGHKSYRHSRRNR